MKKSPNEINLEAKKKELKERKEVLAIVEKDYEFQWLIHFEKTEVEKAQEFVEKGRKKLQKVKRMAHVRLGLVEKLEDLDVKNERGWFETKWNPALIAWVETISGVTYDEAKEIEGSRDRAAFYKSYSRGDKSAITMTIEAVARRLIFDDKVVKEATKKFRDLEDEFRTFERWMSKSSRYDYSPPRDEGSYSARTTLRQYEYETRGLGEKIYELQKRVDELHARRADRDKVKTAAKSDDEEDKAWAEKEKRLKKAKKILWSIHEGKTDLGWPPKEEK